MPANESIPYKGVGGGQITAKATAGITGKTFVVISGNRTGGPGLSTDLADVYQVAPAGAGVKPLGVATYDAASGSLVGVHIGRKIVPVTAGGTIAAGAEVEVNASGQAITLASGKAAGYCMNGAVNGADAEILIY